MKKTKEVKEENIIDKVLQFSSTEDAEEFKRVASGRKFCKKGERVQDICDEEIKRYENEKNSGFLTKIFHHRKLKKNKERLMLESRIPSVIRTIVVYYINNEQDEINRDALIIKVKNTILEAVKEYMVKNKNN